MHKDKQHFTIHGEMGYWRSLNQAILGTCIARAPSVPQANAFILLTNFSVRGAVLSLKTFETFCCPQFFVSALTCLFNQCLNSSKWLQSVFRVFRWWDAKTTDLVRSPERQWSRCHMHHPHLQQVQQHFTGNWLSWTIFYWINCFVLSNITAC